MESGSKKRLRIVAHRGASGYAPESTLEAYRLALRMECDFVEMDVHMLADGIPVVIHDPDVKRTTNRRGLLSNLTLSDLKTLDAGSWFNRKFPEKARPEYLGLHIPTLEEVINLVKQGHAGCYIELKDPERYAPGMESAVLSVVHDCGMQQRVRIFSFNRPSIARVKALDGTIPTALLFSQRSLDPVREVLRIGAGELAIRHNIATARLVNSAHENGLTVSVWTVDREADLRRMIGLGVDAIITNYPDRLLNLLNSVVRL